MQFKRCLLVCKWRRAKLVWHEGKSIAWQRGFPGRTGNRMKLCIVSCHNCYIYGTLRRKEVGMDSLKSSYGWGKGGGGKQKGGSWTLGTMSLYQFVSRLVIRSSQKRLIGFFSKFYMKLEDLKGQKLTELNVPKTSRFRRKAKKFLQSRGFWALARKVIDWSINIRFFNLKMVRNTLLNGSAKTPCLESSALLLT